MTHETSSAHSQENVRYLRFEIAAALFFVTAFTISALRRSLSKGYVDVLTGFILPLALPLVGWYLIARLIHAEALPGDRQFWITRPYRWRSLLCAKVLFVLAFVNLPMMVADAVILRANGFSVFKELAGLAAEQFLITTALLIPMVAIATVTTGLVQVVLVVLIVWAAAIFRSFVFMGSALPGPADWVNTTAALAGVALVASLVIVWQYSRRKTAIARAFCATGIVVVAAISAKIPLRMAYAIQSRITNRIDASSIQIKPAEQDTWVVHRVAMRDDFVTVQPPLRVTGIPLGMILRPDALTVTFEAPDGAVWKVTNPWPGNAWPTIGIDGAFFDKVRNQPIRLRGSAFATVYGNERRTEVPFTGNLIDVPGAGLCASMHTSTLTQITCRYPFRSPRDAVTLFVGPTGTDPLGARHSYSPFPAEIDDSPISMFSDKTLRDLSTAPIVVTAEPLAHIRRDFEIKNLRLSDAH